MNFKVEEAMDKWESEVDTETVRLIEAGVPPYDAVERAKRIVSQRRARATSGQPDAGDGETK